MGWNWARKKRCWASAGLGDSWQHCVECLAMAAYEQVGTDSCTTTEENTEDLPAAKRIKKGNTEPLTTFGGVRLLETINEHRNSKSTFLHCRLADGDKGDAVVILEKTPFRQDEVQNILCEHTTLRQTLNNDIYTTYECQIKPEFNCVTATVIHPATPKHVEKYRSKPICLVDETVEDYNNITKPHIEHETQLSIQWVENILEHKKETEHIVYEDPDKNDGFILIPDMKWNKEKVEDLYLVAICHRRGLRTLRDLVVADHLSLLKNIRTKALLAIRDKFGVLKHHLRIFLHYQPSYYHLHVHFVHIKAEGAVARAGVQVERAHFLDSVIDNLELIPDYYQKASLTFAVKEGDALWEKFHAAGKFSN